MAETYLLILTAVTGLIDAVSFLALHLFTANMTGNVIILGFAVAGSPGLSAARSSVALGCFLAGAVIGGRIVPRVAFGCEAALLVCASASALYLSDVYGVIALTAVAMGMRTATVRKLGIADLNTTVLTLTIAGLAADSSLAGGNNIRWKRRVAAIASLLFGATCGAVLLRYSMALPLVVAAIVSSACALGLWRVPNLEEKRT